MPRSQIRAGLVLSQSLTTAGAVVVLDDGLVDLFVTGGRPKRNAMKREMRICGEVKIPYVLSPFLSRSGPRRTTLSAKAAASFSWDHRIGPAHLACRRRVG